MDSKYFGTNSELFRNNYIKVALWIIIAVDT